MLSNSNSLDDIRATFELLKSQKMLILIPFIIWSAASLAIFGGIFVKIITRTMTYSTKYPDLNNDKDKQNAWSLIVMTSLGVGEIIGAIGMGVIRDKMGNRFAFCVQVVLIVVSVSLVIYYNQKNNYDFVAFVMVFIWGLQDAGTNTICRCMLGFEFES